MVDRVQIVEHEDTDEPCASRNGTVVPLASKPGLLHPNCQMGLDPRGGRSGVTTAHPRPGSTPCMDAPLIGPRVLCLVGDESGCSMWRAWQPVAYLRLMGYPCDWAYVRHPALIDVPFGAYDAIVFCRPGVAPRRPARGEADARQLAPARAASCSSRPTTTCSPPS